MTHLPTGMVVECQNERSQFQNKDKALEILRSRLLAQKQKQQQDAINASRQGQVAPATAAKRSAPTTSRRTAAPITASA